MRQKTNMSGLISHNNPDGSSYQSRRNKIEQQLTRLQKLIDENYKLTGVQKAGQHEQEPKPKKIIVAVGNWFTMEVDFADWVANGSVGKIVKKL